MKPFLPGVFICYMNDGQSVWIAMVTILNNKYIWFFNKSLLFLLKYGRKLMHHPNIFINYVLLNIKYIIIKIVYKQTVFEVVMHNFEAQSQTEQPVYVSDQIAHFKETHSTIFLTDESVHCARIRC